MYQMCGIFYYNAALFIWLGQEVDRSVCVCVCFPKGWCGVLFMRQQYISARDVAILFIVSPRQMYELNAIFIYSCAYLQSIQSFVPIVVQYTHTFSRARVKRMLHLV